MIVLCSDAASWGLWSEEYEEFWGIRGPGLARDGGGVDSMRQAWSPRGLRDTVLSLTASTPRKPNLQREGHPLWESCQEEEGEKRMKKRRSQLEITEGLIR